MSFNTVAPIQEKRKRNDLNEYPVPGDVEFDGTVHKVDVFEFLEDGETLESLYADDTYQTKTRRKEVLTACLNKYCKFSTSDPFDSLSYDPLDLRGLVSLHGHCYNNNTTDQGLKTWLFDANGNPKR